MRKTYKIGEAANILGVSTDTIRYYEKMGIVYSRKDESNGYRYFTASDIFALLDVLLYRSLDIPVEQVRDIMESYQHRDVKKLLEEKEEQLREKIRREQILLQRIQATIEDYRIMDENLGVFRVQPMPPTWVFSESPADNQAYFNSMMAWEGVDPWSVGSTVESGFWAEKAAAGWEMTRMFSASPLPNSAAIPPEENGRIVSFPQTVYTVVSAPWGTPMEEILAPSLDFAAQKGLKTGKDAVGLWVYTDYSQKTPLDYIALYLPVE